MKCYKVALHKSYFDKGYGEIGMLKYFLFLIGFDRVLHGDLKLTLLIGIAYGIFCYLLGILLFKIGWVEAMHEVQNQYNLFQKQIRKKLKTKRFK